LEFASPHFDGKRFFNPENRTLPGFRDAVKMMWSYRPEKWPVDGSKPHIPQIAAHVPDGQAVVTFVNHATVLLQLHGLNVITDPVWAERASPLSWIGPKRKRAPGVALGDLPRTVHMNPEEAVRAHLDLQAKQSMAIHFGTFQLTEETPQRAVADLHRALETR
jgi:L-ascorbate metabolism protein UlaG (beta-lactamase superfamily)